MDKNTWRDIWGNRTGDLKLFQEADVSEERVLLELKKCNGFDVVGEGLTYEAILQQYHQIKEALSMTIKSVSAPIKSVYEVGGGLGQIFICLKGMEFSVERLTTQKVWSK